jgi:hypothetical protein
MSTCTVAATAAPPSTLDKVLAYLNDHRAFFSLVAVFSVLALATAVGAQTEPDPVTLNLNGEEISSGLFTGMNILFGITGLIGILMLPAGLQFAMNIIKGIVGMFQGLRF